ncbi:hypothetical protein ACGFMK_31850 [Amycolatopsis sp. NPDC049252]|uniref:hypothetical protein n=1 Tax=Amycolatopsis sp. NPDC049252 TaxID=3363933 RepID=UPI00371D09EA
MDVRVIDADSLQARAPAQIFTYLTAHGWEVTFEDRGSWALEQSFVEDPVEVWLPKNRQIRGYPSRVAQLLKVLSGVENRSELQILFEITHFESDIQRFRCFPEGVSGTMRLEEGEETLAGLKKWVLSGATLASSANRAAIQPRRKPLMATRFMEQVRLAVPEEGSFIWTVMVPISVDAKDSPLPIVAPGYSDTFDVFNRRVTTALFSSTKLAFGAAQEFLEDRTSLARPFKERVVDGLSANLCEALCQAGGERRVPYELSFSWAQHRPASVSPEVLRFGSEEIRVLGDAAEELRNTEPEEGVTIQGYVVRLIRESGSGPKRITIAGMPDGVSEDRVGHYWLELDAEEYDMAMRAHGDDKRVRVTGDIVRRGNRRWLSGAYGFSIIS